MIEVEYQNQLILLGLRRLRFFKVMILKRFDRRLSFVKLSYRYFTRKKLLPITHISVIGLCIFTEDELNFEKFLWLRIGSYFCKYLPTSMDTFY